MHIKQDFLLLLSQCITSYGPLLQFILIIQMAESNDRKLNQSTSVKMIDFITGLYKKYKVLNKLNEKESTLFQSEVVIMLTDENENVDKQLYKSVQSNMGVPCFILEILANVMNRNTIKNQFEVTRSIASISDQLEKKQVELAKKMKVLERKEEKIGQVQSTLLQRIKDKCILMQNQGIQKLLNKENQIKKLFNNLSNQIKSKEKLVMERYEEIKGQLKKVSQAQNKEKSLNDRIKLVEKKEKQMKGKDFQTQITKLEKQIKSLKLDKQSLQTTIQQLNKKLRNLDLAYRKVKSLNLKKEVQQQPKMSSLPAQKGLQHLDISQIQLQSNQNGSIDQSQESIRFDEQIKLTLNPISDQEISESKQINQIVKIIKEEQVENQQSMLMFLDKNRIVIFIKKCRESKFNREVCMATLELMLSLLESSEHYLKVIELFSGLACLSFLQETYLNHETFEEIAESSTLIISRIKMQMEDIQLEKSFVKAIQIRIKAETQSNFLINNIKSILN